MSSPQLNYRLDRVWEKSCLFGTVTHNEEMNTQLFFNARIFARQTNQPYLSFNNQLWEWKDEATAQLHNLFAEAFLIAARQRNKSVSVEDLDYSDASFVLIPPPGRGPLYPHTHIGITFTLIYYINVLPEQGLLRLWNPEIRRREHIEIQPYNGFLFIAPGELPHDVKGFHGTEERLCVVSNCIVRNLPMSRKAKLTFYNDPRAKSRANDVL